MSTSHGRVSGVSPAAGALPPVAALARQLLEQLRGSTTATSYVQGMQSQRLFRDLRDALNACLEQSLDRFSAFQFRAFLTMFRPWALRHAVPVHGAVHADVGCGSLNPYGRMFTHLMGGVSRAYCVETDPIQEPDVAAKALAYLVGAAAVDPWSIFGNHPITAREILANIADFDVAKLAKGDLSGLVSDRLALLSRSADDTGLANASVDVIFSNSVLEHLPDIDAAMAEFARITKPGGFAMHGIDTQDHRYYWQPERDRLDFLTIDSTEPIVEACNRKRMFEHEQCFARHGFTILETDENPPLPVSSELRRRLVEPWRSMTDEQLGRNWVVYLLRKDRRGGT